MDGGSSLCATPEKATCRRPGMVAAALEGCFSDFAGEKWFSVVQVAPE